MKFKIWLNEDTTAAGASYGSGRDPKDNGLQRDNWLRRPVPDSPLAKRLFFGKFRRKPKSITEA